MDKLENETWEDYAFRHKVFKIKYEGEEKQENIVDVQIPNPDKLFGKYQFGNPPFSTIVWNEIQEIKNKYNMNGWHCNEMYFSYAAVRRMSKEDNERQQKLYELKRFWEPKEKDIIASNQLKRYNRRNELIQIISETHKEQLEELLSLSRMYPPFPNTKEYKDKENEKKKKEEKERIELYQKYMKNKELQTQINELEQKINQLKGQIVK
jgi:hypothetical protein